MGQTLSSRRRNRRQQQQQQASMLANRERTPLSPIALEAPTFASDPQSSMMETSSSPLDDRSVELQSHWVSSETSNAIEESSSESVHSASLPSPSTRSVAEEDLDGLDDHFMEEFESESTSGIELSDLPPLFNDDSETEDVSYTPSAPSNPASSDPAESSNSEQQVPRQFRLSIIYFVPYRRRNISGNNASETENSEIPLNTEESTNESEELSSFPLLNEQLFRILFAMTLPIGANIGNSGDFHNGSFEDLLDYLMRQHQPQGPPPTSKSVLNRLPVLPVDEEMTHETCLVCQENFQMEESALKLPCKHLFHKDCVTTWLEQHCTCPTCRYELPVDDKDYEAERKKRMAGRNIDEDSYDAPEVTPTEEIISESKKSEEVEPMEVDQETPNFERSSSHHNFHAKFSTQNQQEVGASDAINPPVSSQ